VGNSELLHKRGSGHSSGNLAYTRQNAHSVDFPQLSDPVLALTMDELVGALHGFHEPLLFFGQRADDPETHILTVFEVLMGVDSVFQRVFSLKTALSTLFALFSVYSNKGMYTD
jgi:hypothetical protein